jgi:hypothetical protein
MDPAMGWGCGNSDVRSKDTGNCWWHKKDVEPPEVGIQRCSWTPRHQSRNRRRDGVSRNIPKRVVMEGKEDGAPKGSNGHIIYSGDV